MTINSATETGNTGGPAAPILAVIATLANSILGFAGKPTANLIVKTCADCYLPHP